MPPSERNPFNDKTVQNILTDEESGDEEEEYDVTTPFTVYSDLLSTPRRPIMDVIRTSNVRRRLFSDFIEQGKCICYYFFILIILVLGTCHARRKLLFRCFHSLLFFPDDEDDAVET